MPNLNWTIIDFQNGHCKSKDIGLPKPIESIDIPQETQLAQAISELPPASMRGLLQAALRFARGTDDYDTFLKNNPGFHQKILLAAVRAPDTPVKQDLTVNLSWLTSERLSYKREPMLELVQETPRPKQLEPWRDAQPDGLAKTMRDFGENEPE